MSAACLSYCHTSRGCSPLVLSCGLALGPPLLACLVCPSCLIGSSAPHGFRCLPHPLVFLIGSSSRLPASYRSASRPIDKRSGAKPQSTAGGGGEWLTAAAWLLAYPGWRRGGYRLRMAAGGGSDGVAVGAGSSCLLALVAMDGAARSSLLPHLIGSSNRLRSPGASHRRGGGDLLQNFLFTNHIKSVILIS